MSNQYTAPNSTPVYVSMINNTEADLATNIKTCQAGIASDTDSLIYKDKDGNVHAVRPNKIQTSYETGPTAYCNANGIVISGAVDNSQLTITTSGSSNTLNIGVVGGSSKYSSIQSVIQGDLCDLRLQENGGNVIVGAGNLTQVAVLQVVGNIITESSDPDLHINIQDGSIDGSYNTNNDYGKLKINNHGYQGGASKYRDFEVMDGKEGSLVLISGREQGIYSNVPTMQRYYVLEDSLNLIGNVTNVGVSSTTVPRTSEPSSCFTREDTVIFSTSGDSIPIVNISSIGRFISVMGEIMFATDSCSPAYCCRFMSMGANGVHLDVGGLNPTPFDTTYTAGSGKMAVLVSADTVTLQMAGTTGAPFVPVTCHYRITTMMVSD